MIEKIIVRRALKADRFYLPGEVLLPPFSPSIMAEVRAGTGTLEVCFKNCQKEKDVKKIRTLPVQTLVQSIDQVDKSREILFRKFEQMEIPNKIIYKPRPLRGTSPSWFLGRYAPKKRKLLFRQIETLKG
jgi:uncharacterized protein (DUF1919 family)